MNTTPTTTTGAPVDALSLLINYARQRPGLDPRDYGQGHDGWRAYRREAAEITRDLSDFHQLLNLALRRYSHAELMHEIRAHLTNTGDRLTLEGDRLQYITGQYWPTEYRAACCRVLVRLIWKSYQRETTGDGAHVYETGHDIRKAIRAEVSRRVASNYFN